jgi:ABC-type amino acid transport substrate-binding protein
MGTQKLAGSTEPAAQRQPASDVGTSLSAQTKNLIAPEIQKIQQSGYLRIAMFSGESPPYFMENKAGELIGADVELAKRIAAEIGVKAQFLRTAESYDDVVDMVALGDADIGISNLSYTPSRGMKVLYSIPYSTLHNALVINRFDLAEIQFKRAPKTISEALNNTDIKIAVQEGSSYVVFAHELFPKAKIVFAHETRNENIINWVIDRKAPVAMYDSLEVSKFFKFNPSVNLYIYPLILKDQKDTLHIVINRNLPQLLELVNGHLSTSDVNLQLSNLLNEYADYFYEVRQKYVISTN